MPHNDAEAMTSAPRVVLDSNVWIDILVFDDPATRPIHAALQRRLLCAVIDRRCLGELARVLDYPQFVARDVDKAAALASVAQLSTLEESAPVPADSAPLPKCKDRDDQKFLELAHAVNAAWLVSKDRALLRLNKRTARDFGIRIVEPAPFVAACLSGLPGLPGLPVATAVAPAIAIA